MAKPILIRPTNELARRIREAAKSEDRKPGPMVLILLERYFTCMEPAAQPQPGKE